MPESAPQLESGPDASAEAILAEIRAIIAAYVAADARSGDDGPDAYETLDRIIEVMS